MPTTPKQNKQKLEAIWPEVISAVITKQAGRINLCPVNFQAISTAYENPLSVCIGLSNDSYTLETVQQTGEFVFAYPTRSQLADILFCGTISGRSTEKISQTDLTFTTSEMVAPPTLNNAALNCECRLVHTYKAGDFTIVVGTILRLDRPEVRNTEKIYAFGDKKYGIIENIEVLQEGMVQAPR